MYPLQIHLEQAISAPKAWYIIWYLLDSYHHVKFSLEKETQKRSNFPYKGTQPVPQLVKQDTKLIQLVTGIHRMNNN